MLSVLSGMVVTGAGIGSLWYCKPRHGEVQWFARAPILEWLIPISIVAALALGVAMVVSGLTG